MKQYINKAAGLFFVLCVMFIPFLHKELQSGITRFIFLKPVKGLGSLCFENPIILADFSSDTRSLLLLLIFLGIISCSAAFFLKKKQPEILWVCKTVTLYFLAYVLLKYGLDKVFCRQFYQPAPNILYTPFGNLDKDILFWSTIGTSPTYSIITGSIEVLAALLLFFRRTRTVGLLLALAALIQVVIINFSFDISVKIFSVLLTAMALYLLAPQLKSMYNFLVLQKMALLPQLFQVNMPVYIKMGVKFFVIGLMLIETLSSQFFDEAPNPLTGAYEVTEYTLEGKIQNPRNTLIRRIFIHPKNYIILQKTDDTMTDFHFEHILQKKLLLLSDVIGNTYEVYYKQEGKSMVFSFSDGRRVTTTPLPWQQLPALQNKFHFFVDEIDK
ncbi:MAG: hypothetical protein V4581_04400 [Bacteroidota bacterium]